MINLFYSSVLSSETENVTVFTEHSPGFSVSPLPYFPIHCL